MNNIEALPSNCHLKIGVIDDDESVALSLKYILNSIGISDVLTFDSAVDFLKQDDLTTFDLIYTDLIMEGMTGFDLIENLTAKGLDIPIVVVSAFSAVENTVKAIKLGAFDFVPKPFDVDTIVGSIFKVIKNKEICLRLEDDSGDEQVSSDPFLSKIMGKSPAIKKVIETILMVRDINVPVLIEGETGTGKELIAQAIHADNGAYIPLNVSAVNNELIESELFGHLRGSFTGAITNRVGLFEQAEGGTLFFDEINSMSSQMQAKVLRTLQEKKIRPLGASSEVDVSFRLISASNGSLYDSIANGDFRLDLFHRLNVVHLKIPPLRERPEDIVVLANHFVKKFCAKHRCGMLSCTDSAWERLKNHAWPGNVRELENVIERVVIFCNQKAVISESDLIGVLTSEIVMPGQAGEGFIAPLDLTLKELEHKYTMSVLAAQNGNKSKAAKSLNIDFKTLVKKLSPI